MTDYRSRWLDLGLSEQYGAESPDDPTDAILNQLTENSPAERKPAVESGLVKPSSPVTPRWISFPMRIALAVCLLFAISIVSYLVSRALRSPEPIPEGGGIAVGPPGGLTGALPLVRQRGVVTPAGAQTTSVGGQPVLRSGWAYVDTDHMSVLVGVNLVEFRDTRAVIMAGGIPDVYELWMITESLRASDLVNDKEELSMLHYRNRWFTGAGLALCLIVGTATIDGQTIVADDNQDQSANSDEEITIEAVFKFLDKDESGFLEAQECICHGSKAADLNQDGKVTKTELKHLCLEHFGSEEKLAEYIAAQGGIAKFFEIAAEHAKRVEGARDFTFDDVFACYDKDKSGVLEPAECVCYGTKMADANEDGKVTKQEVKAVAEKIFGDVESFLAHVEEAGGPAKFYELVVASGK